MAVRQRDSVAILTGLAGSAGADGPVSHYIAMPYEALQVTTTQAACLVRSVAPLDAAMLVCSARGLLAAGRLAAGVHRAEAPVRMLPITPLNTAQASALLKRDRWITVPLPAAVVRAAQTTSLYPSLTPIHRTLFHNLPPERLTGVHMDSR
jgi:hypothetical protein